MNVETNVAEVQQSIIPKNLSERDTAFVLMLAKEKVVQKLQQKYIDDIKEKDMQLKQLNQKLQKKVYIDPEYVTTKNAAAFIGVDTSYLTKRQGKVFQLGVHYFKPEKSTVRWSLAAISKWLTSDKNMTKTTDPKLAKLLERR